MFNVLLVALFVSYSINCSIDGWGAICKPEGRGLDSRWGQEFFQCAWSFQLHHGSGDYSACNRNEYRKIYERKQRVGV
jgi:hypothetical protein